MTEQTTTETALTDEQISQRMKDELGLDLTGDAGDLLLPVASGGHDASYVATRARPHEVPTYFGAETPQTIAQARQAVLGADEQRDALVDQIDALQQAERDAKAALAREAVTAAREGRSVKYPKARDFASELLALQAQHRYWSGECQAARKAFTAAMEQARPAWLATLHARCPELLREALDAIQSQPVPAAVAAVERWHEALNASVALWQELNPKQYGPTLNLAPVHALKRAVADVLSLLQSDDEAVTGAWITDTLQPPRRVREQMANSGGGALIEVLRIESDENWRQTHYSLPYAVANGLAGEVATTPSGVRFLALPQLESPEEARAATSARGGEEQRDNSTLWGA